MRQYNPIESIFPFIVIVPIGFYLLGKLLGVIWLQEAAGYMAAAVICFFIIAAISGSISSSRFLSDPKKKAERVKRMLDMLKRDVRGMLEVRVDGVDCVVRWDGDKFLLKAGDKESVITEPDLSSKLMAAQRFPRFSSTQI